MNTCTHVNSNHGTWDKIDVWTEPSAALQDINHMFRGTERDSQTINSNKRNEKPKQAPWIPG
jgi:hypothetical protein